MKILLDEQPSEGGNGNPSAGQPVPVPSAPPVAETVLTGKISEREADLQAQIDVLKAERDGATGRNKKLETDISHLQDQLSALRSPNPSPQPPVKDEHWTDTFLGN